MEVPFSADDVQLAVIQFGSNVDNELTFEESRVNKNYDTLVQNIDGIRKGRGGSTFTASALSVARGILQGGR